MLANFRLPIIATVVEAGNDDFPTYNKAFLGKYEVVEVDRYDDTVVFETANGDHIVSMNAEAFDDALMAGV